MSKIRILHNDQCPICAREVKLYNAQAQVAGVDLAIDGLDRAGDWGLDPDRAAQTFRVEVDGIRHEGLAAFRALWRLLPHWRWLAVLTGLPVVAPLADRAYRHIAAPLLYRMHLRRLRRRTANSD